jgi:2-polyprenyl-3-methyl-5-hydroxy-6-metoxy-1,4-benzoquinol methylase
MKDYIGNELELFKHAHNWKKYYASFIEGYLKNDVLEVGAGIGETTHLLCDGTQNCWVCIEPDELLTKEIEIKKENGYLPFIIEIITGTLDGIDSNRKFETIIYIDVIEHIENDEEELKKAANFLKPNGHIIILVPAHNYLFSKFDKSIGHYRRYNKEMLAKAIPKGFQKVDLRYLDSIGLFASLANKWFLKQDYPTLEQIKFWDNYIIPVSKIIDAISFYSLGKTVVGVWKNTHTNE